MKTWTAKIVGAMNALAKQENIYVIIHIDISLYVVVFFSFFLNKSLGPPMMVLSSWQQEPPVGFEVYMALLTVP